MLPGFAVVLHIELVLPAQERGREGGGGGQGNWRVADELWTDDW
jgi:hypothetical protein